MRYSLIPVLWCLTLAGSALAIAPAGAALYPQSQVLAAQTIQQFLANPSALLEQYPNGGPAMIKAVEDLTGSDPGTLAALIGLLSQANTDQATAIGDALGQIALKAVDTDPDFANQIQTMVVQSNNISAEVAFSAVVGGKLKLTAATTGIGGGAETSTSSTGGGSVSGGSNFAAFTTSNVQNGFSTTAFSGGSGGGPGCAAACASVSPASQ
jgi:hypothetical protein